MKKNSNILLLVCLIFHAIVSFGQKKPHIENLLKYDTKPYHFGFLLGINQMNFSICNTEYSNNVPDTIMTITSIPQYGFNICIISNLKIGNHFDLRFIPGLAFGERWLEYTLIQHDTEIVAKQKRIESTFIDFPLLMKYKSTRLVNVRSYVITGIKYSIDLASQAGKKSQNDQDLIKLRKSDWSYEFGVGFDFYLEYFKFATEIKMSYGIRDLLIRENTVYTNSIRRLNSKIFLISFLFE